MHKVMHSYALLTQPDRIILRSASNFFLSGGKEKKKRQFGLDGGRKLLHTLFSPIMRVWLSCSPFLYG